MVKQLPHVHKTDLKTTRGNCAASPRNNAGHCSALGRGYITWCDTITHHGPLFGPFCCALRSSAVGTSVAGRRNSSASLSFITPPTSCHSSPLARSQPLSFTLPLLSWWGWTEGVTCPWQPILILIKYLQNLASEKTLSLLDLFKT